MIRNGIATIAVLLTACNCLMGLAADVTVNARETVADSFARMGWKWPPFDKIQKATGQVQYLSIFHREVIAFAGCELDQDGKRLLAVFNPRLREDLQKDVAIVPLSRVAAIEEAKRVLIKFAPEVKDDLGEPDVTYEDERQDPFLLPWWRIRWTPVFHKYRCLQDYFQVALYNDAQVMGVTLTTRDFPHMPKNIMTKEKASEIASNNKALWMTIRKAYGVTLVDWNSAKSQLFWTHSRALDGTPLPDYQKEAPLRLAWILAFDVPQSTSKLQIWIDVETGDAIGTEIDLESGSAGK